MSQSRADEVIHVLWSRASGIYLSGDDTVQLHVMVIILSICIFHHDQISCILFNKTRVQVHMSLIDFGCELEVRTTISWLTVIH